jgi:hypothetical protein
MCAYTAIWRIWDGVGIAMNVRNNIAEELAAKGFAVLKNAFSAEKISEMRACILSNCGFFKNTRPNPSAGHLAGFHRYPGLESLHTLLTGNDEIASVLKSATQGASIRSIGLSDITINRSQEWHVDLLRGKYRSHLSQSMCWGPEGGGVYKALLYLQPGKSLKVVPGGHLVEIDLDSDRRSEPAAGTEVENIELASGDVILMDIRLPHRGSTESELENKNYIASPKILVSTVMGADSKPMTRAMEMGNFERLMDWDLRHRGDGMKVLSNAS